MREMSGRLSLGVAGVVAIMAAASCGPEPDGEVGEKTAALAGSRLYTLDADFDEGVLDGVEHDTVPDQLQLSVVQSTLPFIWIANSGENSVSKIDTVTGNELGRYRTGPGSENPSRTTVDIDGNVWVGCSGNDSYINTEEVPTRAVPQEVDYKVVKLAKADGRVLLSVPVG